MSNRHLVSGMLWNRQFRLISPEAKAFVWYVRTHPNKLSEGLYRMPLAYAAHDLNLSLEKTREALTEAKPWISYDEATETVLDRWSLRDNPLKNSVRKKDSKDGPAGDIVQDKRIPGGLKKLEGFTDSPLLQELADIASRFAPDFALAMHEHFPFLQAPSKVLVSPLHAPSKDRGESEEKRLGGEEESEAKWSLSAADGGF